MCYNKSKETITKTEKKRKENVSNKHTFAAQYIKYCISICTENKVDVCDLKFVFCFSFVSKCECKCKMETKKEMYNFVEVFVIISLYNSGYLWLTNGTPLKSILYKYTHKHKHKQYTISYK